MKCFDRAPQEVIDRANALIDKYHPDLKAAEVTIDYLFVSDSGDGPALKLHGVPCYAIVRIVSLKDRAKGLADAEILIDRDKYDLMDGATRDALLDHELYHLVVRRDDLGQFMTDDQHRPKLKMRPHDWEFGWFEAIAARHGDASIEVKQATKMRIQAGQILFGFMDDTAAHK
jgi:hypothetical protein